MFGTLGIPEILIILVIGIVVFGVIKMPRIVRSLGSGVKQFQRFRNVVKNPLDHIDDFMQDEPAQNQQQYYGPNPDQQNPQGGGGGTNQQPGWYPGPGQQGQWQSPPGGPEQSEDQKPPGGGSDKA